MIITAAHKTSGVRSAKSVFKALGLRVTITSSSGFALTWSPSTVCKVHMLSPSVFRESHKPAYWMVHFMTHFTPAAAATSVLVPTSPWGACSPLTYKLLCSTRCFLTSSINLLTLLCGVRLRQQLTQILLLVYSRQWSDLISWLIKCLPWTQGISIINQTSR